MLQLDPATVGRRVQRLEEQVQAPLFVKTPQGYTLTAVGQGMMEPVLMAEQALILAQDSARSPTDTVSGVIRIGAPDGCANFLLPQVCARICDDNPDLELQILALPRVVNLSRREADLAIAVSQPTAGRLVVQKLTDYHLHLAASEAYLARHAPLTGIEDLRQHRMIGYIPDMIFDKELDYLANLGPSALPLASNSVSVQFQWIRQGAGLGIVHDFALPAAPGLRRVLTDHVSLSRSFYLVRHADDRRNERLNRLTKALIKGVREEIKRLETQT